MPIRTFGGRRLELRRSDYVPGGGQSRICWLIMLFSSDTTTIISLSCQHRRGDSRPELCRLPPIGGF